MTALPQSTRRKLALLKLAEELGYALEHPTWGPQRVSNELRLKVTEVGPSGVRGVWLRHELETRHKRLLRLETVSQGETIVLFEEQPSVPAVAGAQENRAPHHAYP